MGEQPKKTHISAGLLAHVGASRREPRKNSTIPGPNEPGIFHSKTISVDEIGKTGGAGD